MATKANIAIEQGTDVAVEINISNETSLDITGYTCRAQMRRHYQSQTGVTFTCAVQDSNTVLLSLTNAQSANVSPGRYVYDVELVSPGGIVTRLVEGLCTVSPEVTKL